MLPVVALLYDAVALVMWALTRSLFDVETLGGEPLPLDPGTLIVVPHRRETDIPLVCPSLYLRAGLWRRRERRVAFAGRDDLHAAGFLAGFPPRLPLGVRKLLYPLELGPQLRRNLVLPVSRGTGIRIGEIVEALPERPLGELLPDGELRAFRRRAVDVGLSPPALGRDVVRAEYVDLLWRELTEEEGGRAEFRPLWERHTARAATEFREVVALLRRGAVLFVFPEGRPSPDGAVGPLLRGVEALVRLGRPRWVQPIGIAYDPLTAARTRAVVAFPARVAVEGPLDVLALLRAAVPVTCGQIVAEQLLGGVADATRLEEAVADAVARARRDGRFIDPRLLDREGRARRVAEAVKAAERAPRAALAYLAREHESARAPA